LLKLKAPIIIEAKTSGYENKKKNISYSFIESTHNLCLDRIEIILAQIQACERLSKYAKDHIDLATIEKEIIELKFVLGHYIIKINLNLYYIFRNYLLTKIYFL
jgi:hypothetical protein